MVDFHRFDRGRSQDVARDVSRFNADLVRRGAPYVLIGVGRWGSAEPFLGIPVSWEEIAGARAIVEAGFRDFRVAAANSNNQIIEARTGGSINTAYRGSIWVDIETKCVLRIEQAAEDARVRCCSVISQRRSRVRVYLDEVYGADSFPGFGRPPDSARSLGL